MNCSVRDETSCRKENIQRDEFPKPLPPQLTYFGKAVKWLNEHEKTHDFVMYRPSTLFQCILGVGFVVYIVYLAFKVTPWVLLGLVLVPIHLAIRILQEKITSESQNQKKVWDEIVIKSIQEFYDL